MTQETPSLDLGSAETETQSARRPSIGFSIASLVLGIAGILLVWVLGLGLLLAVAAIVFGILGLKRSRGLAIAGIVTGGLSLAVGLLVLTVAMIAAAVQP
ncbi:hypothetical protein [Agromyces sp. NPDC056965]|uniref:hypothetical protein n=1 Tax=Agromyces sp. NPDC056965 TaxID=3345983 RepID=UPI0036399503